MERDSAHAPRNRPRPTGLRITRPVQNLRWNESPINILNNIEMMGRPEQVLASEAGSVGASVIVPPLKVRNFNFTSVSDAI